MSRLLSTLLQHSYQETIAKMTEYFSPFLQCTTAIILGATAYYIYSLIKMANEIINELLPEVSHDPLKSDVKRQKLTECVLTGNSIKFCEKLIRKNKVKNLMLKKWINSSVIMKLSSSGQMVKSLGKSIIKMYLMGACAG